MCVERTSLNAYMLLVAVATVMVTFSLLWSLFERWSCNEGLDQEPSYSGNKPFSFDDAHKTGRFVVMGEKKERFAIFRFILETDKEPVFNWSFRI